MRGDGRIFRRGHIWWIAYCRDGREYRESSRGTDEAAARRLLRNRLSTPTLDSLTIQDLVTRPEILEHVPKEAVRDLYADCLVALRKVRARLSSKLTQRA